jgi:hypothetical protein
LIVRKGRSTLRILSAFRLTPILKSSIVLHQLKNFKCLPTNDNNEVYDVPTLVQV